MGTGGPSSLSSLSLSDITGGLFPSQRRPTFPTGGPGILDTTEESSWLPGSRGMTASGLGFPSPTAGFPSIHSRLGGLSLAMPGTGSFANAVLHHQGLIGAADSQTQLVAAGMNMNNMSMNLDAVRLRDVMRMSNSDQLPTPNVASSRSDLQDQIFAMQMAKGYEKGNYGGSTSLGLPPGMNHLHRGGGGGATLEDLQTPANSLSLPGGASASAGGHDSAAFGNARLARSPSQQLAGLPSSSHSSLAHFASNSALAQELLHQQMLQQQHLQLWEEESTRRRNLKDIMAMREAAGSNGTVEGTQSSSTKRFSLTGENELDSKRRRFN